MVGLVLVGIAVFLYLIFWTISKIVEAIAKKAFGFSEGNMVSPSTIGPEQREEIRNALSANYYFNKLSYAGKEKFLNRTISFLGALEIYGMDNYNPDKITVYHVAAAAAQLTFGLEDFLFANFDTVELYPSIFRVSPTAPPMKGGTTADGIVRISVKDFDEGYKNPTDRLNVGLHELGHALFIDFLKQVHDPEDEDEITKQHIRNYLAEADRILELGKDKPHFLRDYAYTNRHEFFAVTIEHFFEASGEFKEKLPSLFTAMSNLLNQDPNFPTRDYAIASQDFTRIS